MPNYTKPPVTPAWAENKVGVPADLIQPTDAEIQAGWPLTAVPPSRQRFNWALNWLANAVRYFMQRGLVDYDALETYAVGARIIGDDGKTYKCIQAANIGHTPSTSPIWWERWGFTNSELDAKYLPRDFKDSVRLASSIDRALNGLPIIDGVQTVAGDRVLLYGQATPAQNGIWVVAAGAWVRAADADVGMLSAGACLAVIEGAALADTVFELTTNDPIVVGTTALSWIALAGPTTLTIPLGDARYLALAAGVKFNGVLSIVATTVHTTASIIGKLVTVNNAAATTQTLPLASTVAQGQAVGFTNLGAGIATFARQGADSLLGGLSGPTSFVLNQNESFIAVCDGAANWHILFANGAVGLAPQTLQNVAASRTIGGGNTNLTPREIMVMVSLQISAAATAKATVDGLTLYGSSYSASTGYSAITFPVPPGKTYSVTTDVGTPTINTWVERR